MTRMHPRSLCLARAQANPELSQVPFGGVQYFRYTQTDTGDVIISATPLSGSVSLYVANSAFPGMQTPSANNSVWSYVGGGAGSAAALGVAYVVIPQLDPGSLACSFPCTYTIAVVAAGYAAAPVDFTVMARTRTGQAVELLDGEPLVRGGVCVRAERRVPIALARAPPPPRRSTSRRRATGTTTRRRSPRRRPR